MHPWTVPNYIQSAAAAHAQPGCLKHSIVCQADASPAQAFGLQLCPSTSCTWPTGLATVPLPGGARVVHSVVIWLKIICGTFECCRYNGITANASDCPNNYPSGAPLNSCGHVSLVELDAQQTYKQAMAFWATGNAEYAKTALNIIEAWASDNQVR